MFKVGDIVRCKTDRYGITSYKRPCEVVGILVENRIQVKCLGGDGSSYDVNAKLFEPVPSDEVLHKGMYVKTIDGELCKFVKYGVSGITVSHDWREYIYYDNIRYLKRFIV